MRHIRELVFAAAILAAISPAAAYAQDKRVNFVFGGGFTAPNSEVRDHLGDGYNLNVGLQVNITRIIAIEGLYSFNGLGDKQISLPVSVNPLDGATVPTNFSGDMNMQYGTGSVIVQKPEGHIRPYGLVGGGVYYRPIKVTTPGVGYVPGYCDPWWYVCSPGGFVAVDHIVGERSSTDFGMGFGGGVNFGMVFAELRYHYIWGPTVGDTQVNPLDNGTPVAGTKANGQFFATTFGIRF